METQQQLIQDLLATLKEPIKQLVQSTALALLKEDSVVQQAVWAVGWEGKCSTESFEKFESDVDKEILKFIWDQLKTLKVSENININFGVWVFPEETPLNSVQIKEYSYGGYSKPAPVSQKKAIKMVYQLDVECLVGNEVKTIWADKDSVPLLQS